MNCTKQNVVDENCVCNNTSELALTDEDNMNAWFEHYASGAAGEEGIELTRQLMEAFFKRGVIPSDREESFILNL